MAPDDVHPLSEGNLEDSVQFRCGEEAVLMVLDGHVLQVSVGVVDVCLDLEWDDVVEDEVAAVGWFEVMTWRDCPSWSWVELVP